MSVVLLPESDAEDVGYCNADDLLTYYPALDGLFGVDDTADPKPGLMRQCERAREWLDEVIIAKYQPSRRGWSIATPGYNAYLYGAEDAPSKWLRDQLDAGKLIVTAKVREICAKRALSYLLEAQTGSEGEDSYAQLGRRFARESGEMVKTLRAEIDSDGDGYADVVIHCGMSSLI